MPDWFKFATALVELLTANSCAAIAHCPECGDAEISAAAGERQIMMASAHGVSIPIKCGGGHTWTLRISSWRMEYPDLRKILAARQRIWELEDLQTAIRNGESEVARLREKYFDLRNELAERHAR